MKKVAAILAAFILILSFAGCGKQEKEHITNTFPLEEETINQILADNELPMVATNFTEMPVDEAYGEYCNHSYILYDTWEASNGQGVLQFLFGDIGNRVTFSYLFAVPGTSPSWKYHEKQGATEQAIATACDLYGGFEDKDGLVEKITKAMAKDDLRHYNKWTIWYEKYENVHILVQFATKGVNSDDKLYFRSIQIADDKCFKNTLESSITALEKSSAPENYDWAEDIYDEVYG